MWIPRTAGRGHGTAPTRARTDGISGVGCWANLTTVVSTGWMARRTEMTPFVLLSPFVLLFYFYFYFYLGGRVGFESFSLASFHFVLGHVERRGEQ